VDADLTSGVCLREGLFLGSPWDRAGISPSETFQMMFWCILGGRSQVHLAGNFALHRRWQQAAADTGDGVGEVAGDGEFRVGTLEVGGVAADLFGILRQGGRPGT
jgi:hypothetical protein